MVHSNTNFSNYFQWHCHNIEIIFIWGNTLFPKILEDSGTVSDFSNIAENVSIRKKAEPKIFVIFVVSI